MIYSVTELRRLVELQLRARLPENLPRVAATVEGITLPEPKTWTRLTDFSRLPEEKSPAVYITGATLDRISMETDDETGAPCEKVEAAVKNFVVVRGRSPEEVNDRIPLYVAALRYSLFDDPSLGRGDTILGRRGPEDYGELPSGQKDTYVGAGSIVFYYRFLMSLTAPLLDGENGGIRITKIRVHPARLDY